MPMRRPGICLLLCVLPALAQDDVHHRVANRFVAAFEAQDNGTMVTLGAQSASKVPYALVLFTLLERGEEKAAVKLAELRAHAPEGEGLKRLVLLYREGGRASNEQRVMATRAESLLRRGKAAEALEVLDAAGKPLDGTITGARMEWTRARAWAARSKSELAAASFAECARIARTCGWIQLAAEAEKLRLQVASTQPSMAAEAMKAATAMIEDARAMDHLLGELQARIARASLHRAAGDAKKAREDYSVAVDRARALQLREVEAKLLGQIAFVYYAMDRLPKRARKFYAESLSLFLKIGEPAGIARARFNFARLLTDTAQYDEALAQLEEALGIDGLPEELRPLIEAQRAYVLRQQGRLEKSLAAYRALLEKAETDEQREALSVELGDLQRLRGDYHRALERFRAASGPRALGGAAAALGGLRREEECRRAFAAAVEAAESREEKGRFRLQWVAFERAFGRIDAAIRIAEQANRDLAREDSTDYGNAATSWVVLADLYLLDGRMDKALGALAKAAVIHERLQDPGRAIPAYARETLVLLGLEGKKEEAIRRHGTLLHIAESVSDPRLKSMTACTDAVFLHRTGRPEEAAKRFAEARALAREAGDPELEANALATRALFAGAEGLPYARKALALLDAIPDREPERHPLVVGERPDDAASIALRCLLLQKDPDPELAFELVERVKARRLQLALGGRDAILVRRLPEEDYRRYVDARSRLREARAENEGVEEARAALVALQEELGSRCPLAFPEKRPKKPSLRGGEALLLYVDDAYARGVVAMDSSKIVVKTYEKPLDGLEEITGNKARLLVSPDGFAALEPEAGRTVRYVGSAATLRRGGGAEGLVRVERTVRVDLRHPAASDSRPEEAGRLVVIDRTEVVPGASVDGYAAVAVPRLLAGADAVLISLSGETDPRIVETFLAHVKTDGKPPDEALALARQWARGVDGLDDPAQWGSLVLWGAG